MIIPVLMDAVIFTVASKVIVPLPVPLDGEAVSQVDPLFEVVQGTFEVTLIDWFPPDAVGVHEFCDISSCGWLDPATWRTETVLLIPPPETVIIPDLDAVVIFAAAFSVIEPLPVPPEGDTVSQSDPLFVVVQDTFEVTAIFVLPPDAVGVHEFGETSSSGGDEDERSWVTVITLVIPPPVTVTLPVLPVAPVFSLAPIINEPLPIPPVGATFSQAGASVDTVQDTFDVTVTNSAAPDATGLQVIGETIRY